MNVRLESTRHVNEHIKQIKAITFTKNHLERP
jgi:hypothetical protein